MFSEDVFAQLNMGQRVSYMCQHYGSAVYQLELIWLTIQSASFQQNRG